MYRKVIKQLIVLILTCALVCPSYCALVNDGSSFVTKAEFDSALADFNGRLTTFEAGINSKIDSQVTSYLDRNGIWQGKKQTLHVGSISLDTAAPTVALANNAAAGVVRWGNYIYVDNLTKSGLAVGSWKYKNKGGGNDNTTRWGWSGVMQSADKWKQDNGFFLALNILVLDGTKEKVLYSKCFGKSCAYVPYATSATSFYMCMPLTTDDIIVPFQFFIVKDQPLYWNLECTYHFYFTASVSPQTADNAVLRLNMGDIQIY